MKQDLQNRASALKTARGLLHCLKMSRTLVHKRLITGSQFLPTLRKFCILLHCQLGFAHGGRRRELNQTLRHVEKWIRFATACQKFEELAPLENWGAKTAYFITLLIWTKSCQMTTNRVEFLPTFRKCSPWLRCQRNKVALRSECKWNHRNQVAGVQRPKHFQFAMASRRAALSGDISLIATFSSIQSFSCLHISLISIS